MTASEPLRLTIVQPGAGPTGVLGSIGVAFKLWGEDTGGALSVVEHPFPVGALVGAHLHTREDEYSIVTEGEIGFRSGEREVVLGSGGYITKPRGEMHAMWNAGTVPARMIEIISPAGFEHFRELAEMVGSGAADLDQVPVLADRYGKRFGDPDWPPGCDHPLPAGSPPTHGSIQVDYGKRWQIETFADSARIQHGEPGDGSVPLKTTPQETIMVLFLTAVSGIAWTIVYIVSILIGVKQETYAIPVAALALNIAWESIYTVHGLATDVSLQAVINLVWAMADVAIVYTYFRYGRRELPNFVTRPMFVAWGIAIFVTAYVVQWLFVLEFDWSQAARYSAFLQNLLMSGLFIAMFVARRGDRGQSVLIAAAKWIGTLAPTIVFGAIEGSAFILTLGILCSVFDLAYIGLIIWAKKNPAALIQALPEEQRTTA